MTQNRRTETPSRIPEDDAELAARLRLAVTRLSRRLRQEAAGEVSPSQVSALATVERRGPLTLSELAAAERVQPPSMTRIVAGLEELRLVARTVDPADRRIARVAVTPEGQRLLHAARTRKTAYVTARLRQFSSEERAELARAVPLFERLLEDQP